MQCAKHNVGHISISCIFIQMCTYILEYKELQFLSHNNVSSRQSSPHRQYGKLLLPVLPEERL